MKIVSLNILSATHLKSRHITLMRGGIRCLKNKLHIRLFAEGPRPDYIPRNWKWINWEKYPRGQRHIRVVADGLLDKHADYHVFMDDDSLTDIDHMVEVLNKSMNEEIPFICSGWPGRTFTKSWTKEFLKHLQPEVGDRNLDSMWIGYEISVINKALAVKVNGSSIAKKVLCFSDYLDTSTVGISSPPDLQISMLAWIANAKHLSGNVAGCQQWPNFINYSGINKNGSLWHVHWTEKSYHTEIDKIRNLVSSKPTKDLRKCFEYIFPKTTRGLKAKNYFNIPLGLHVYFAYWHAGEYEPHVSKDSPSIMLSPCGKITILNYGERLQKHFKPYWKSIKNGMKIHWHEGFESNFMWLYNGHPVGYDKILKEPIGTTILMPAN